MDLAQRATMLQTRNENNAMKNGLSNARATIKKLLIPAAFILAGWAVNRQHDGNTTFWFAAGSALAALLILKLAWRGRLAYLAIRARKSGAARLSVDDVIGATTPGWLYGVYLTEKKIYAAFARAMLRRPLVARPVYPAIQGERYGLLVPLAVLLALVDLPFTALMIGLFVKAAWLRHCLPGGMLLLTVYGLIWLLGDLRALKESGHSLSADTLRLELGVRCSGEVPLREVRS
ncbi:MAG TPA: hypothetical protein VIT92_06380, partial [Burkholderiaceae bacterium]